MTPEKKKGIRTMTKNDGGPAFPYETVSKYHSGMSLRDWFAGQALPGIIEKWIDSPSYNPAEISYMCYEIAKEMLERRELGNEHDPSR